MDTINRPRNMQKRCVMDNVNGMWAGKLNKNTFVECTDHTRKKNYPAYLVKNRTL